MKLSDGVHPCLRLSVARFHAPFSNDPGDEEGPPERGPIGNCLS